MSDITVNIVDEIVEVNVTDQIVEVNVNNAAGPQGPAGPAGQGVPVGGTTGQVLSKASATNYDTQWTTPLSSNIYNSDGTLTGNRLVTMGANTLSFEKDIVANSVNIGKGNNSVINNLSVGVTALAANTTGSFNSAVGYEALKVATTANYNTAFGTNSLRDTTVGDSNTAIGANSLTKNINGTSNAALGGESLSKNTSGTNNSAFGWGSLSQGTTSANNSGIGFQSLRYNLIGENNIAVGSYAGSFYGASYLLNQSTNNSIFIGFESRAAANAQTNQIVIGHQALGLGSNTIVLGNSSTSFGRWYGNLLLGTSSNSGYLFDAAGTARITGNITASSLSGATTRMVVADSAGVLSTQTIPSLSSGGSSVNYYLNGSITASVAGYKQLSKTAIIGAGTNFTLSGNGLIAQFLTDAGDPNRVEIPSGAWNFEMYFSSSSNGGSEGFYVELLKYDGSTFTSIASSSTNPESITGGTSTDLYLTSLAVPTTALLTTDRLAIRVYIVNNSGARTVTLKTEDNNLCEIITTFAGGVSSLNGLTANTQYLATGTSGTDFNISSVTDTHTFNLPTASATNRGALSSADFTTFNNKVGGTGVSGQVAYWSGTGTQAGSNNLFWDATNGRLGIRTNTPLNPLHIEGPLEDTSNAIPLLFVRNTNATNVPASSLLGLAKSSGDMADGFGMRISFAIQDNTFGSTSNLIAAFGGIRSGADNSGSLIFQTATSGTLSQKAQVFPNGNLVLQNGGTFTDGGQRLQVIGSARIGTTAASAMYWDDTNSRLGIGTNAPTDILDIRKNQVTTTVATTTSVLLSNTNASGIAAYVFTSDGTTRQGGLQYNNTTGQRNLFSCTYTDIPYYFGTNNLIRLTITGSTGNVLVGTQTDSLSQLTIGGSKTASSAIARGTLINTTLTAAANNDVLVGLDVAPTFTNGAFTGVSNYGIRASGQLRLSSYTSTSSYTGTAAGYLAFDSSGNILSVAAPAGGSMSIGGSITSATAGSVLFADTSGILQQDNANFFWDNTNDRLGIGTITPTVKLHIESSVGNNTATILNKNNNSTGAAAIQFINNNSIACTIGVYGSSSSQTFWQNNLVLVTPNTDIIYSVGNNVASGNTTAKHQWHTGGFSSSIAKMTLTAAGRLLLGKNVESTFVLDVSGLSRFEDSMQVTRNVVGAINISVNNNISSSTSIVAFNCNSDLSSGGNGFGKYSSLANSTGIIQPRDTFIQNNTSGDIAILNNVVTGKIKFAAGGSSTVQMEIAASGATTFSNNVTVNGIFNETVTTNRQTASYTLVLADRGKLIEMNVATANDLTVPLNSSVAYPVGTKIDIVQYGAGQTTVVATVGVTINSTNTWKKINAQYGAATLVKIATDEWYLFGNLNA